MPDQEKIKRGREKKIAQAQREADAALLWVEGNHLSTIAAKLGYANPSGAWKAINRALRLQPVQQVATERALDLERCRVMLEVLWPKVKTADIEAITAARRVMERRARLLGLDAPERMEFDALVRWTLDLGARPPGEEPEASP